VSSELGFERVALRVLDRVDGDVDVELRPMKMPRRWPLNPKDGPDGSTLEPWELVKGQEQLTAVEQ
jgi:hypothetical protein